MEHSVKRIYKFGLLTCLIFGIILMIHGLIFGALEVASSWLHLALAVLVLPFITFSMGILIPRDISRGRIKHSFLLGLIGSVIFISLTHYLTPLFGSLIGIEPSYSALSDDIGLVQLISLSIWGIVSSTFTSLLGTIFSPLKEVEKPEETFEEVPAPEPQPESEYPPAPGQQPPSPEPQPNPRPQRSFSAQPPQQQPAPNSEGWSEPASPMVSNNPSPPQAQPEQPGETERYDTTQEEYVDEDEYVAKEESRSCMDCGGRLRWIDQYEMWYCDNCQEYKPQAGEEREAAEEEKGAEPPAEEDVEVKLCPHCVSELRWIEQYGRWYCDNCQQYIEGVEEKGKPSEETEEVEVSEEEVEEEEEEEITQPCPDCDGEVRWLEEYNRWYCENCKEYKSVEEE
ncbi:MAG: hypothetical protein ACOCTR_03190 [Candidatus Natronoplasma sp.]